MGIRITNDGWVGPEQANPDERHRHLPFWYDVKVENTAPPPMLGIFFWMMPLVPKDEAAEWLQKRQHASNFIARRSGLTPGMNFKLMPQGEYGLRFAFATLGGMNSFSATINRLTLNNESTMPTASNDPDKNAPVATIHRLPMRTRLLAQEFPRNQGTRVSDEFTPVSSGKLETFEVKGQRAANNRHAQPKAPVLAFKR